MTLNREVILDYLDESNGSAELLSMEGSGRVKVRVMEHEDDSTGHYWL